MPTCTKTVREFPLEICGAEIKLIAAGRTFREEG